jgi:hypothetical protein
MPKQVMLLATDRHMIQQGKAVVAARGGKGREGTLLLFCDAESALGSGHGGREHCERVRCPLRADGTRPWLDQELDQLYDAPAGSDGHHAGHVSYGPPDGLYQVSRCVTLGGQFDGPRRSSPDSWGGGTLPRRQTNVRAVGLLPAYPPYAEPP